MQHPGKSTARDLSEEMFETPNAQKQVVASSSDNADRSQKTRGEKENELRIQQMQRFMKRMALKQKAASPETRERLEKNRRNSVLGTGVAARKVSCTSLCLSMSSPTEVGNTHYHAFLGNETRKSANPRRSFSTPATQILLAMWTSRPQAAAPARRLRAPNVPSFSRLTRLRAATTVAEEGGASWTFWILKKAKVGKESTGGRVA